MLQVLPAPPPVTGYSDLGQALMGGATDYANEKRRTDEENRKRANYLSDVQSERGYQRQQFDNVRALQMADEQRRRGETLTDAQKRAQFDNRLKLLQDAEQRGIFAAKDIGNIPVEDAALAQLQQQTAKETAFSQSQPGNAQATDAQLAQEEIATTNKLSSIYAALQNPPKIDLSGIEQRATDMARQNLQPSLRERMLGITPQPSKADINAMKPAAIEEAKTTAMQQWYQMKEDAKVAIPAITSQLNTIKQQRANLTSTFHVTSSPTPVSPGATSSLIQAPATSSNPSAQSGNPLDAFKAQFQAELDKNNLGARPAPQDSGGLFSSPAPASMQDLNSALQMAPPEVQQPIRAARTNLLVQGFDKLAEPLNAAKSQLANVNEQLHRVQNGLDPFAGVTPTPMDINPAAKGEFITKLLLKKAAAQTAVDKLQQAYAQGKTSLLSQIPRINTPAETAPAPVSSPGSMLSDPYSGLQSMLHGDPYSGL